MKRLLHALLWGMLLTGVAAAPGCGPDKSVTKPENPDPAPSTDPTSEEPDEKIPAAPDAPDAPKS